MTKWQTRFFELAYTVAGWSKDPVCQVGAVLVSPSRREFSFGYNGLPTGIEDDPALLLNRELKNSLMVHAEVNAIINAKASVEGWHLYCTKAPCLACTKLIINAKIATVNCPMPSEHSSWFTEHETSFKLLSKTKIGLHYDKD